MTYTTQSDQLRTSGRASNGRYPDRDADEGLRPRKKQRRQRPSYSCAECRRLKMKCDRQVPCSNCVRRHRVAFCEAASSNQVPLSDEPDRQSRQTQDVADHRRLSSLENAPDNLQSALPVDNHYDHSPHNLHIPALEESHESARTSGRIPTIRSQGSRNDIDQLALLARALQPETVLGPASVPTHGNAVPEQRNFTSQPVDVNEGSGSYGTLMLSKGGRSRYLGPTAGSEWLKDSETQNTSDTPPATRPPSPKAPLSSTQFPGGDWHLGPVPVAFPFNSSAAHISTQGLLSHLPPKEKRGHYHDVAPKPAFQRTFDRVYQLSDKDTLSPSVNPQEIALVYIVMAQGTMYNIEMPNYDSSAEDWLHLSERALVKGNFLSNNMVAGLQTLHLMAHLHLQLDKDGRRDNAWPLWGLVMRLIQAMGMHRDGARWNLPQDVVEERRKVFWECNAADTFQAHCFSRPCAINPEHCDVAFPSEPLISSGEKSYSIIRFELSQLSSEILNMAMKVRKPRYSDVIDLDVRLGEFERNVPFSLRCRAALLSMPSRYPQFEAAIEASPEPSRRSMTISFQQMNLALNISETIINLHRPYYAKALYEDKEDTVRSIYATSFLTVIERCAVSLALVVHRAVGLTFLDHHIYCKRHPHSLSRGQYKAVEFLGKNESLTSVLRNPANPMATFVLAQIDAAIDLFTSVIQQGANTPRYRRNLQWLLKLRTRASSKISAAKSTQRPQSQRDRDSSCPGTREREDSEDVELLGWRTRLIERAGQDRQTIRTIDFAATPDGSQPNHSNPSPNQSHFVGSQGQMRIIDGLMPGASLPFVTPDSTDDLLQEFWDPMLLQEIFGPSNG
ncbi:Zn(II)2Cys6 transcription factor [Aspergillus tanneri]|uniref:Zn(2)-C6 fungal-type domain-containing protein n=1 Tax=Aspergillus tanneri TaxID=1220188 RepID=A0A5M9MDP9_9EURO|nr:uncharacterized protein ATNIH1004_011604 [Aspergillus tanneri]KAA8642659.1 hypothetical protein ATNIH1004_011604 [Aspergillus tanneri]